MLTKRAFCVLKLMLNSGVYTLRNQAVVHKQEWALLPQQDYKIQILVSHQTGKLNSIICDSLFSWRQVCMAELTPVCTIFSSFSKATISIYMYLNLTSESEMSGLSVRPQMNKALMRCHVFRSLLQEPAAKLWSAPCSASYTQYERFRGSVMRVQKIKGQLFLLQLEKIRCC